jgi:hypothetical protein
MKNLKKCEHGINGNCLTCYNEHLEKEKEKAYDEGFGDGYAECEAGKDI